MRFLLAALPVGSLLVMACDATGPGLPRPVSLSVMIQPSAASPAGLASDVTVGSGPNSIRITKVEFVLAETELAQAATCSSPPATDDNCDELELDPAVTTVFGANISLIMPRPWGRTIAPSRPCSTRELMSISGDCATAHSSDAAVNPAVPMRNIRLRP